MVGLHGDELPGRNNDTVHRKNPQILEATMTPKYVINLPIDNQDVIELHSTTACGTSKFRTKVLNDF